MKGDIVACIFTSYNLKGLMSIIFEGNFKCDFSEGLEG